MVLCILQIWFTAFILLRMPGEQVLRCAQVGVALNQ